MDQKLPSEKLAAPRRPWVTVGVVAAIVVAGGAAGIGAQALTRVPEPLAPRAQYEIPENMPPVPLIGATTADLTVNVDASGSTDDDGLIVSYLWDFGDGATSSEVTTTHTYGAAGTYSVTLTITDDGSRPAEAIATADVTVTAPPPPPASNGGGGATVNPDGSVSGSGCPAPYINSGGSCHPAICEVLDDGTEVPCAIGARATLVRRD